MSDVTPKTASDKIAAADEPGAAVKRLIRIRRSDSAYVYAIFESHGAILAWSTVDHRPGETWSDIELQIPIAFIGEVDTLLQSLGNLIYDLQEPVSPASESS
jgi:hypothetical protein